MKPALFSIPADFDTVAIFKRDIYSSDTSKFQFHSIIQQKDTTIKFKDLSNDCIDALTTFLKKDGYFSKVENYHDSLNFLLKGPQQINEQAILFQKTRSDICIFLDFFYFSNWLTPSFNDYDEIKAVMIAKLLWTVTFKNDTAAYIYNQVDTIYYDLQQLNDFKMKTWGLKSIFTDDAEYLGQNFGKKLIPTWTEVERIYYKSGNLEMQKAEELAMQDNWLAAAEIWNRETKNKNHKIVAKASFNLALACEMEGKPDIAIDWLVKSYSALKEIDNEHKANCQRYVNVLALRMKEIEKLANQVRPN